MTPRLFGALLLVPGLAFAFDGSFIKTRKNNIIVAPRRSTSAPAEASLATEAFLSLRPSDKASFECSLPELKTVCVGDEECAVGDTVRDRMLEWLEGQDAEKLGITERGSRTAPRPPVCCFCAWNSSPACSGASIRLGVNPRYLPLRRGVRLGVDELLRARLDAAHGDVALERRVLRALRLGHDVLKYYNGALPSAGRRDLDGGVY